MIKYELGKRPSITKGGKDVINYIKFKLNGTLIFLTSYLDFLKFLYYKVPNIFLKISLLNVNPFGEDVVSVVPIKKTQMTEELVLEYDNFLKFEGNGKTKTKTKVTIHNGSIYYGKNNTFEILCNGQIKLRYEIEDGIKYKIEYEEIKDGKHFRSYTKDSYILKSNYDRYAALDEDVMVYAKGYAAYQYSNYIANKLDILNNYINVDFESFLLNIKRNGKTPIYYTLNYNECKNSEKKLEEIIKNKERYYLEDFEDLDDLGIKLQKKSQQESQQNLLPFVDSDCKIRNPKIQNKLKYYKDIQVGDICEMSGIFDGMIKNTCHIISVHVLGLLLKNNKISEYECVKLMSDVNNAIRLVCHIHEAFDSGYIYVNNDGTYKVTDKIGQLSKTKIKKFLTRKIEINEFNNIAFELHNKYFYIDSLDYCKTDDDFLNKITDDDIEKILKICKNKKITEYNECIKSI